MTLFGAPVRRKEDGRLLRGRGRYVSDVELPRMLHVACTPPSTASTRSNVQRLRTREPVGSGAGNLTLLRP